MPPIAPVKEADPKVASSAGAGADSGDAAGTPEASPTREALGENAEIPTSEDAKMDDFERFAELGGVLLPRPVNFQGPDIDPYLPWVREVDVATMIATLSAEIGLSAPGAILPSGAGTSSGGGAAQLEAESIYIYLFI